MEQREALGLRRQDRPQPLAAAEGGEVLVRGANVFVGYHKQAEATQAAIDAAVKQMFLEFPGRR